MSPAGEGVERLTDLLDGLVDVAEGPDLIVSDLTMTSQNAGPGQVFLAVRGTRMHGLAFAAEAVARGASCVVYESGEGAVAPDLPVPSVGVPELSRHVGEIAARFHGRPSDALALTAINGTDGKTSVAWLMSGALAHLRVPAHYIGTLGSGVPM